MAHFHAFLLAALDWRQLQAASRMPKKERAGSFRVATRG
jgi:hypothetical protein